MTPAIVAAVIGAGIVGAVARYLVSRAFAKARFLWAVLVVNVVGSALGGLVLGLAIRGDLSSDIRLVLLTGLCGGLTTFSTWSVETIQLVLAGKTRAAALNVASNLLLGMGCAAAACAIALALP